MRFFRTSVRAIGIGLVGWAVMMQVGCFSMRTSERGWRKELAERGQLTPVSFIRAQSPTVRLVHAVALQVNDTLPVVVGLHGSPGSSDAYLDYLADTLLTARVQFIAVDRPGFGYTDLGSPEPSLARQALDIKAVLDSLVPGKKVVLVGHSLGGPLIVRFTMDHPALVKGLVIVAGSVDPKLEPHPWWQRPVDHWPINWFVPQVLWCSNHEILALENELRAMLLLWSGITCPVRVLHARNDRLVPFGNAAFSREHLTGVQDLVVDSLADGDHFILWNRRDHVTKAILDLVEH